MESEISGKIHVTIIDILNSSDNIDSMTEQQVRNIASQRLNMDLSHLSCKIFIRHIIEAFLLSTPPQNAVVSPLDQYEQKPLINPHSSPTISKLSQPGEIPVRSNGGELSVKDGNANANANANATPKSISLFPDQLSNFQKSSPVIEEPISKMESRLRSKLENKQDGDKSKSRSKQNGAESINKDGPHHRPTLGEPSSTPTLTSTPKRLVPMEIIRFNGKNYHQWFDRMESYLNQLKVSYVLSEPCPSAIGVVDRELSQTLMAAEKWMNDDHICRQNILNSLCDNIYRLYFDNSGTAKDIWEELKLIYLNEEHGEKISLVKKYIEFQIVEEKSVYEQVHELNQIADSLIALGMYVEEKFHVNVIISKLPASWKPYTVRLMKEDQLLVWMLMNHLKAEEESISKGNKCEIVVPRANNLPVSNTSKNLGPHKTSMKRPGVSHSNHESDRDKKFKFCGICKKKGHNLEQCWFRSSGWKDTTNEKDKLPSENAGVGEDTNGAVGP